MSNPLRSGTRALLGRLRGRPDSEHEMSFNRVALGAAILVYALSIDAPAASVALLACYLVAAVAVLIHISRDTRIRPVRRLGVIVLDVVAVGHVMYANGEAGAGCYPLYIWLILGNGFRFGLRYLWAAVLASVISFALVIALTPFWRDAPVLSTGLMLGVIALPAYAATLIRKLSAATAAAEEASRAKSYFLASVSHELRTPLTAIIGLGEHLATSAREAEARGHAATIVGAGRQLLTLINRLLDFSRVEAQGQAAESKPFDLARLLASVRELMAHEAARKGLAINVHLAAGTPLALRGDEAHLRDVLVNLVGNALKFTEAGSVTIVAGVEPASSGQLLRLAVADTGIGIAPEAQDHIFGSFRQADATIIDRYGGTGLGLAICRQLVTLMGGEIGVTSRPGAGSRFWFTARVGLDAGDAALPGAVRLLLASDDAALAGAIGRGVVARARRDELRALYDPELPTVLLIDARWLDAQLRGDEDEAEIARALSRGAVPILLADPADPVPAPEAIERICVTRLERTPSARTLDDAIAAAVAVAAPAPSLGDAGRRAAGPARRILVADDNAMNQKVISMLLGRAGHHVTCADDGERALDLMREGAFDAVLMDVNMPVLNGIETTKLYRFASLGQKRLPIIAVTADASPANAERCLEAGMDACIAKPIDAAELLGLVDRLCAAADAPPAMPVTFDPAGVVAPLFRPAAAPLADPAVDGRSLEELEELGGAEFVADLLDDYVHDSQALLAALTRAVATGDVAAFRDTAHALRSSAANIGAHRVAEMCLHYQRIGEAEFHDRGARHRDRLAQELARVTSWLEDRAKAA